MTYLLPKLRDIFLAALFFAIIAFGPRLLNIDGDLGRHITLGNWMLHNGILTRDVFSHTLYGQPLTPHEWLAQIIFAVFYNFGGLNAVVWLCALLISLTFILVYQQAYRRGTLLLPAFALALWAAAASSLHWLARPHLFTMLFLALWMCGIETVRRREPFRWWLLPVLMLVWANTHGAFIAGFVTLAPYLAEEVWNARRRQPLNRQLWWVTGAALLASLLNPDGWHLWQTSLGYIRNAYLVGHTAEYLPPNFHDASTYPFLLLLAFTIFLLTQTERKLPLSHTLLLTGWSAMALYSVRNVPLFAIVSVPILAEITADLLRTADFAAFLRFDSRLRVVDSGLRGALIPIGVALLLGAALSTNVPLDFEGRGNIFLPETFPVAAADFLAAHPQQGNVFNYFPWGGYLLYRFEGKLPVFIDGQTDFYGEALTREYEQVLTLADGWQDTLDKYAVTWALLPANEPLAHALRDQLGWQVRYSDDTAWVLVKEEQK